MNINSTVYEKATTLVQDNRLMTLLHDWREMPRPLWNGKFETIADAAIAIPVMERYGWTLENPYPIWDWFETVRYVVKMYFFSEFHLRLAGHKDVSVEDMDVFADFVEFDLRLKTITAVAWEFKDGHLDRLCTEKYIKDYLKHEYDMDFDN